MNRILFLSSMVFAIQTICFGQQVAKTNVLLPNDSTWHHAENAPLHNISGTTITGLEIPKTKPGEIIITHLGYALVYNEAYEQASWVAYELTKKETHKGFNRTNKFIADPKILTSTANNADYSRSGYDQGHLAPAGDMVCSATAMAESFYYSNMSPQKPSFNRGIWKRLEELVRSWAVDNQSVYIVTGPVLTSGLSTIGDNKVAVPQYFYKVILDYTIPEIKGIGFILPNIGSKKPLQEYAVTIDSVERFTGIDFFPKLPGEQEENIERTLTLQSWSWNSSKFPVGKTGR